MSHSNKFADLILPVLDTQNTSIKKFVECWGYVPDPEWENLYLDYKALSNPDSIETLYHWKNGGNISKGKMKTLKNYKISKIESDKKSLKDNEEAFLNRPGGAIWNIFWAHLLRPKDYPIFDQHVYRAMLSVTGEEIKKLPSSKKAIIQIYLDEYLPFFERFGKEDLRKADLALWNFGRYLKQKSPEAKPVKK